MANTKDVSLKVFPMTFGYPLNRNLRCPSKKTILNSSFVCTRFRFVWSLSTEWLSRKYSMQILVKRYIGACHTSCSDLSGRYLANELTSTIRVDVVILKELATVLQWRIQNSGVHDARGVNWVLDDRSELLRFSTKHHSSMLFVPGIRISSAVCPRKPLSGSHWIVGYHSCLNPSRRCRCR